MLLPPLAMIMVRLTLLRGCDTWLLRVANERMLAAFGNNTKRLTNIPARLVLRRLHWFGHAARRPEEEAIKAGAVMLVAKTMWRPTVDDTQRGPGAALQTVNAGERAGWKLAQDRPALSAPIRDVVSSIGAASSTHPGECRHKCNYT